MTSRIRRDCAAFLPVVEQNLNFALRRSDRKKEPAGPPLPDLQPLLGLMSSVEKLHHTSSLNLFTAPLLFFPRTSARFEHHHLFCQAPPDLAPTTTLHDRSNKAQL